jgi:hypothetical protein
LQDEAQQREAQQLEEEQQREAQLQDEAPQREAQQLEEEQQREAPRIPASGAQCGAGAATMAATTNETSAGGCGGPFPKQASVKARLHGAGCGVRGSDSGSDDERSNGGRVRRRTRGRASRGPV